MSIFRAMKRCLLIACLWGVSFFLLILVLYGCGLHHATESDIARWHGFKESERDKTMEVYPFERCYSHPGSGISLCYDLDAEDTPKRLFPAGEEK